MILTDPLLDLVSSITRRLPPFRGLQRIWRAVNAAMLKLGASPIRTATMNDGTRLRVDLRSNTEAVAFYRGQYDPDLIEAVIALLDPDATFVDIGANIGFYTVAVGAAIRDRGGEGRVVAFEPFAGNYRRLNANIQRNALEGVCDAQMIGLSDTGTESEITLREDFAHGSTTGNAAIVTDSALDGGFERATVELQTLDAFCDARPENDSAITVIKMDIEGHEDFCLRGAQRTLASHRPIVLMEVNKPFYVARNVDLDATFLALLPPRYRVYRRQSGGWVATRSLDHCREIDNVFLVAEERAAAFEQAVARH